LSWLRSGGTWLAALTLSLACAPAHAGDVRYDYDELGRLVRVIDEQGGAAVYLYGPTGNLLQILREDTPAGAPTVAAVTPGVVRRGQTRVVQISGANLLTASVSAADPKLILTVEQASASALSVKVVAASDAALGASTLTVSNSAGTANTSVEVRETLVLTTAPAPVVLPPDSLAHVVMVRLSDAEPVATSFSVSGGTANIATVTPVTTSVPAGQLDFPISITGLQQGRSSLQVTASAIGIVQSFPIVIAASSAPASRPLGVLLPPAPASLALPARNLGVLVPPSALGVPAYSPARPTGIALGTTPASVAPVTIGAGTSITLTVSGYALAGVTSISVTPSTGVSVGSPLQVSGDQTQVSVPISVACNAALNTRAVVVNTAAGRVEFSKTSNALFTITGLPPAVTALSPSSGSVDTSFTLTVQGTNLACASSVTAEPSSGITFTSSPVVSADGTSLTVGVSIAVDAPQDSRVIRVVTPFGASSATPSGANSFTVTP